MTIGRLLLQLGRRHGHAPAVIEHRRSITLSFAELAGVAFGFAVSLRARGLAPGDRYALIGDNAIEYLIADYGGMCAGLVRTPLDPSLSADELSAQVRDAGAQLVVFCEEHRPIAERVANDGIATLALDWSAISDARPALDDAAAMLRENESAMSALASLNYTGGTSGMPKAVMLTHANLRAIVGNIVQARGFGPGDTMVNMRPLWPIAAVILLAHIAAGGTVVLGGRFDPAGLVSLLEHYKAAATTMVPTHLVRVLRDCPADRLRALSALQAIDIGAAAVSPEMFEQALDAFGPKLGILYGLTEASWSCYQPPRALDCPREERRARVTRVGWPVLGCDIRIDAAEGEAGEVLIRGANVMQGYWRRPELTAEVLVDGWFRTGDLGQLGLDGSLAIVGRLKSVIRSGGKSVDPSEVEAALTSFPGVTEAAVVGLPDAEWGERVAAAVVVSGAIDEQALRAHCTGVLSAHKRPRLIRIVPELPRSHYGKVQLGKVKELLVTYVG